METQERTPVLTGREGAEIDIKVAAEWTRHHRHRNPGGVVSQFFGRELLEKILQQPNCVGLRFYYANAKPLTGWQKFIHTCFPKSEGEAHLIIAGVTQDGMDQLPCGEAKMETFALKTGAPVAAAATASTAVLGEQSLPCPGSAGCPQNTLSGGTA